jgi:hypothetical protein
MTREQLETYVAEDQTDFWFESGYINDESDIARFIKDNPPLPTVSGDDPEPMPLNKQVYFQDYYHGIIKNASASEKRQEELYFDTSEEISPYQIAMTIYEYENPNHVLARDEMAKVVERKSFEGWQEKNPNEVMHMAEDNKPEEELLLRAEQVQTLSFINKDAIKLTSDQIDNPEDPDFNQVMDLVFNIKSRKQLANFIRSANIEQKDEFLEAGVDELLQRLNQTAKEKKQDKTSNPGNTVSR